jgi:hypothetical protein
MHSDIYDMTSHAGRTGILFGRHKDFLALLAGYVEFDASAARCEVHEPLNQSHTLLLELVSNPHIAGIGTATIAVVCRRWRWRTPAVDDVPVPIVWVEALHVSAVFQAAMDYQ